MKAADTTGKWTCLKHNTNQTTEEFCLDCVAAEHEAMKQLLISLRNRLALPENLNSVSAQAAAARDALDAFAALGPLQSTEDPKSFTPEIPNEKLADSALSDLTDASVLLF